ncbi:DotA/TraY family protein [Xanthobacter versatilis]|uniref:DotA/TraY family protein n=1 Tax=Xanthobacter autotrophicus (strain ATCC BAA-1158 / Py2) TaxID=78245 RepID=UPI003729640A
MADASSFSGIFTPVQNDYALISLRRVLGCTVDAVWKGTTCSDANMIATAAAFFNVAVAIVGALFITYTLYAGVADTAREGEAMGGNSVKYTIARVGLGAVMILPVSSGFTLAQLLVIQILVWGSGAADNLWTKISPMIASGGYSLVATVPEDDYKLRGMIAGAIRARAVGYVCAYRLNEIAETFGHGSASGGSPIVARTLPVKGLFGQKTDSIVQAFVDSSPDHWYNGSNSLCGSVQYQLPKATSLGVAAQGITGETDLATWQKMNEIAINAATSGLNAAWSQIDSTAKSIANVVYSQGRNDEAIIVLIGNGVASAQSALRNAVNNTLSGSDASIKQLAATYLEETASAGWVFAISWQRANINIAQYFQSVINAANIEGVAPDSLSSILQPMSQPGWFGSSPQLTGSTWRVLADNYERDVGYMRSFDPYFADFTKASPSQAAGQVGVPDTKAAGVSSAFRWVLSKLKVEGDNGTSQWSDPLLILTEIGVGLVDAGLWALGGAAVSDVASGFIPYVGGLVKSAAAGALFVGGILVVGGFWIGGVLPLMPLIYFFGAVVSWLVIGLEALIAVPIWVLTHFFPAREPSLIGASRQGYLLLFGLLARPILIIMGLIVSLLLMSAAFAILNSMFFSVFALMIPLDSGPVTSAITSLAAIAIYGSAATIVVWNSCALISELGDAALRWVEIGVQSLWSARFGSDVFGQVSPAAGITNMGRSLGSGALQGGKRASQGLAGIGGRLRSRKPDTD